MKGWWVSVSHTSRIDGGSEVAGGRYLRLPPPEHSCTVHCDQAHYGPVSGGGEASGVTGGQAVVVTLHIVLGRGSDGGLVSGTGGV